MGYHAGRETREKTRVDPSKGFQKFNSKRSISSGHSKGSTEVTNTATILKDKDSHFLRHWSTDSVDVPQIQHLPRFTSRLTAPLALKLAGQAPRADSQISLSTPVPPLLDIDKKGESNLSCT